MSQLLRRKMRDKKNFFVSNGLGAIIPTQACQGKQVAKKFQEIKGNALSPAGSQGGSQRLKIIKKLRIKSEKA